MAQQLNLLTQQFNFFFASHALFFTFFLLWSLFWQGWAMWLAAKKDSKLWFVVFLLVHTAGLLEIIYIFWLSRLSRDGRALQKDSAEISVKDKEDSSGNTLS